MIASLENLCIAEVSKKFCQQNELKYVPVQIKNKLIRIASNRDYLLQNISLLRSLLNPYAEVLNFSNCTVGDEMLEAVSVCCRLKLLNIGNDNKHVSFTGLSRLFPKICTLDTFIGTHCNAVNDDLIQILVKSCPSLTTLNVAYCKNMTNPSMAYIGTLKLNALNISGTNISDEGVMELFGGNCAAYLTELILCRCPITPVSVDLVFTKCPKLSIFTFQGCQDAGDFGPPSRLLKEISWTI